MEEPALSDEDEGYLHGLCHLYALALHEATGLPIQAALDVDLETGRTVLVHAWVSDGGEAIDVRGRLPEDAALDGFDFFEPETVALDREELMLIGHGRRRVSDRTPELERARELVAARLASLCTASPAAR